MEIKPEINVMVGISTEQNTANLVPFTQFQGKHLVLAETDEARNADWSAGPERIIERRANNFTLIPIGRGDSLSFMTAQINEFILDEPQVCWNFGGGQKMQQLSLFNLFLQRLGAGKKDWACYTDPKARTTHIITIDNNGNLQNSKIATDAYLTLEEIILIFGNEPGKNPGQLLWSRFDESEAAGPPLSQDDVHWFYDATKRKRMFRHWDLEKVSAVSGQEVYPGGWRELGDYFEKVVQYHVTNLIKNQKDRHTVNEVWANVEVFNGDQGGQIAEYDVLLVTNFGTVIPLDAKSGIFGKKDEDARSFNLRNISGRYTSFFSVFPYFPADLDDGSVLLDSKDGRQLLSQPFAMKQRGSRMLVLSDKGTKQLSITRGRKNKIRLATENDAQQLTVHTLESMLDELDLHIPAL